MEKGDAVAGARLFVARCSHCHTLSPGGPNKAGPNLFGVVGRKAGHANYYFSEAHSKKGVTWTPENLFTYLENPRQFIPGTKKAFPGVKDPKDRADIIAFLKTAS
ncbi:hypothetical protein BGX29_011175 [Mortierella sp. GBA35]|nr:hypothetical protein BGX23_011482 [Mortierella sp. AD031]KAF9105868.1 hypothetical protein BGX29_011175 [Mortierella sp. GBA35]KAG0211991.1 hypothetical protein BGX33_003950 [Mortierella sp. NVP41]